MLQGLKNFFVEYKSSVTKFSKSIRVSANQLE